FIIYLFVSRMLVNDIKIFSKLDQPVGVENLPDQADFVPRFRSKQLLLKKLHLFWRALGSAGPFTCFFSSFLTVFWNRLRKRSFLALDLFRFRAALFALYSLMERPMEQGF